MCIVKSEELRNIAESIKDHSHNNILSDAVICRVAIKNVLFMSNMATCFGLSELEEVFKDPFLPESFQGSKYLEDSFRDFLTLVIEKIPNEELVELMNTRFYIWDLTEIHALVYLIYAEGTVLIKDGKSLNFIEKKLEMMLPYSIFNEYKKLKAVTHNELESDVIKELGDTSTSD